MKLKKIEGPSEQIPTSSMADIAFLLIVFFMMTSVFSADKGMEHLLPPEIEQGEPEEAIFVEVLPDGTYRVDGASHPLTQTEPLYAYVQAKIQINARKPILFWAHGETTYGDMISILSVLRTLEKDTPDYTMPLTIPSAREVARFPKR